VTKARLQAALEKMESLWLDNYADYSSINRHPI
jgi:hypothetical protein